MSRILILYSDQGTYGSPNPSLDCGYKGRGVRVAPPAQLKAKLSRTVGSLINPTILHPASHKHTTVS